MTISHSVPATTRRPGRFTEFNIAAASRGLTPLSAKMVLIGTQSSAASKTAETLNEVFAESDADTFYGTGSPLAVMIRWAMKGAKAYGKAPRFFGVGVAEPGGGTAKVGTLTVSGTATASGNVKGRIAGVPFVVGVDNAAAASDVAADLEAVLDELAAELTFTASVAAAVVTVTATVKGENGSDGVIEVDETPVGISVAVAETVAGAGVIDITNALAVLVGEDFDYIVIENHKAADVTDLNTHMTAMWTPADKKFRWSIMAETGTLATGQALATAHDDYKNLVISAEDFRNLPGQIAAYVGAMLAGEDDPALPFNDQPLPDLAKPDDDKIYTSAEIESGIAGGMVVLNMNAAKTEAKLVRAVTTKVTHNSVPFFDLLDVTISRSMVYAARQVDIAQALMMSQARNKKKTSGTLNRLRSVAYATLKKLEEEPTQVVQNVDDHADELTVETDGSVPTRAVTALPLSIVPPLNQVVNVFNLILE